MSQHESFIDSIIGEHVAGEGGSYDASAETRSISGSHISASPPSAGCIDNQHTTVPVRSQPRMASSDQLLACSVCNPSSTWNPLPTLLQMFKGSMVEVFFRHRASGDITVLRLLETRPFAMLLSILAAASEL